MTEPNSSKINALISSIDKKFQKSEENEKRLEELQNELDRLTTEQKQLRDADFSLVIQIRQEIRALQEVIMDEVNFFIFCHFTFDKTTHRLCCRIRTKEKLDSKKVDLTHAEPTDIHLFAKLNEEDPDSDYENLFDETFYPNENDNFDYLSFLQKLNLLPPECPMFFVKISRYNENSKTLVSINSRRFLFQKEQESWKQTGIRISTNQK